MEFKNLKPGDEVVQISTITGHDAVMEVVSNDGEVITTQFPRKDIDQMKAKADLMHKMGRLPPIKMDWDYQFKFSTVTGKSVDGGNLYLDIGKEGGVV